MPRINGTTRGLPHHPRVFSTDNGFAAPQRRKIFSWFSSRRIESSEAHKKTFTGPVCGLTPSVTPSDCEEGLSSSSSTSTNSSNKPDAISWAVDLFLTTVGDGHPLIDLILDSDEDEDDEDRKEDTHFNIIVEAQNTDQPPEFSEAPVIIERVVSSDSDLKVGHFTCVDTACLWDTVEQSLNTGCIDGFPDETADALRSRCGTPCTIGYQLVTEGLGRGDGKKFASPSRPTLYTDRSNGTQKEKSIATSQIKERDDLAVPARHVRKSASKNSRPCRSTGASRGGMRPLEANARARGEYTQANKMKNVNAQSKLEEANHPPTEPRGVEFNPTRLPRNVGSRAPVRLGTPNSKILNGCRKVIRAFGRGLFRGIRRVPLKQPKAVLVSQYNCAEARPLVEGPEVDAFTLPSAGSVVDTGSKSCAGASIISHDRGGRSKQSLFMEASELSSGDSTTIEEWSFENSQRSEEGLKMVLLDRFSTTESLYATPKTIPTELTIETNEDEDDEVKEFRAEINALLELFKSITETSPESRDVENQDVEKSTQLLVEENTASMVLPQDTTEDHGTKFEVGKAPSADLRGEERTPSDVWLDDGNEKCGITVDVHGIPPEELWDAFPEDSSVEEILGSFHSEDDTLSVWFNFNEMVENELCEIIDEDVEQETSKRETIWLDRVIYLK